MRYHTQPALVREEFLVHLVQVVEISLVIIAVEMVQLQKQIIVAMVVDQIVRITIVQVMVAV